MHGLSIFYNNSLTLLALIWCGKRNSREELEGIQIPQLAKITTMFPDWWRSLNYKKGLLFDWIEREGDSKGTHCYTILEYLLKYRTQ